jgi:hypothetical protein
VDLAIHTQHDQLRPSHLDDGASPQPSLKSWKDKVFRVEVHASVVQGRTHRRSVSMDQQALPVHLHR